MLSNTVKPQIKEAHVAQFEALMADVSIVNPNAVSAVWPQIDANVNG